MLKLLISKCGPNLDLIPLIPPIPFDHKRETLKFLGIRSTALSACHSWLAPATKKIQPRAASKREGGSTTRTIKMLQDSFFSLLPTWCARVAVNANHAAQSSEREREERERMRDLARKKMAKNHQQKREVWPIFAAGSLARAWQMVWHDDSSWYQGLSNELIVKYLQRLKKATKYVLRAVFSGERKKTRKN